MSCLHDYKTFLSCAILQTVESVIKMSEDGANEPNYDEIKPHNTPEQYELSINSSYSNVLYNPVSSSIEDNSIKKQLKILLYVTVVIAIVIAVLVILMIILFVLVFTFKKEVSSYQQMCCSNSSVSEQEISGIKHKLFSYIRETELLRNNTNIALTGLHPTLPASSCAAILSAVSLSPSGYYWVKFSNGSAARVYCDMTRTCGGITGGWMRVADVNMSVEEQQCPSSLCLNSSSPHTCRLCHSGSICSSDTYDTGLPYTRVCGRIRGYQIGTPNDFFLHNNVNSQSIDRVYIDGVSLTHGSNPRQHIWSFAAALQETNNFTCCPCINLGAVIQPPPAFVENNYFCDTAIETSHFDFDEFYAADPLWDGSGCGNSDTCCSFNNPPWFHRLLSQPTADAIEMRICRDQERMEEDIGIDVVELYIQ